MTVQFPAGASTLKNCIPPRCDCQKAMIIMNFPCSELCSLKFHVRHAIITPILGTYTRYTTCATRPDIWGTWYPCCQSRGQHLTMQPKACIHDSCGKNTPLIVGLLVNGAKILLYIKLSKLCQVF